MDGGEGRGYRVQGYEEMVRGSRYVWEM